MFFRLNKISINLIGCIVQLNDTMSWEINSRLTAAFSAGRLHMNPKYIIWYDRLMNKKAVEYRFDTAGSECNYIIRKCSVESDAAVINTSDLFRAMFFVSR